MSQEPLALNKVFRNHKWEDLDDLYYVKNNECVIAFGSQLSKYFAYKVLKDSKNNFKFELVDIKEVK